MGKRLTCFFMLFAFVAQSQTRYLTAEPNHSSIGFRVPIANGMTAITGRFTDYDLQLTLVDGDFSKSQIEFETQATNIDTGIPDRDSDLQSQSWFDSENTPEIKFSSKEILLESEGAYLVKGDFTMKGITKPINFVIKLNGIDNNTIGMSVRTKINRLDFDIGTDFVHTEIPNFIAEEIDVEIDLWTKRDKRKPD
ncbi:MAG: YceI family protein [Cyclobacteriaceae bacterium]